MKKIIAMLLALAMVLSLAACGAKEEAPAETNAAAEAPAGPEYTEITLKFGTSSAESGEYGNSFFNMGMYPVIVDARFTQVCFRGPPDQIAVVRRQGRIGAGESDRFFVCVGADLRGDRVAQSDGLHTAVQFMIAVIAASCNVQE